MGAIGLREVPRALRFLRWALPDQRVNIRGKPPIPPNSRKVYSLDFALQNRSRYAGRAHLCKLTVCVLRTPEILGNLEPLAGLVRPDIASRQAEQSPNLPNCIRAKFFGSLLRILQRLKHHRNPISSDICGTSKRTLRSFLLLTSSLKISIRASATMAWSYS